MGHPDKVCDQISDGILDAILAQDPLSRVACEALCTTDLVVLAGEITTRANVDYVGVTRSVVRDIGYTSDDVGFNADSCRSSWRCTASRAISQWGSTATAPGTRG